MEAFAVTSGPPTAAPDNPVRDLLRLIDLSEQPGRFRAAWCMPGGSYTALGGDFSIESERDADGNPTGWQIATYTEAGHTWTGRSQWGNGAFLAMLADRCGLVAQIDIKPERDGADGG